MIVALGASDGESEERAGDDFQGVCKDVVAGGVRIGATARAVRAHAEVTGSDEEIARGNVCRDGGKCSVSEPEQFVSGNLLEEELVERLVRIQTADDVVAVLIGEGTLGILIGVAVGVSIAGDVEPVPSPSFPVSRRLEQTIDELLVRIWGRIGEKGLNLSWRRGESEQIEIDAPNQREPVSVWRQLEVCGTKTCPKEGVDWSPCPITRCSSGDGGPDNGLEGPMGAFLGRDGHAFGERGRFRSEGWGAGGDPDFDPIDLRRGELAVPLGHFTGTEKAHDQTFCGVAWCDRWTGVPTAKEGSTEAQVQTAFRLVSFAMAVEAMFLENRPDVAFEGRSIGRFGCERGKVDGLRNETDEECQ
jgi:hypothetical protein